MLSSVSSSHRSVYVPSYNQTSSGTLSPNSNKQEKAGLYFGAGESSTHHLPGGHDTIEGSLEGMLINFALTSIFRSFRLSEDQKLRLKKLGMPDGFATGIEKLKVAKDLTNRRDKLQEAKVTFELAANQANLHMHKATCFRMAAISAKLMDDTEEAKKLMSKSKEEEDKSTWDKETIFDLENPLETATDMIKGLVFLPFGLLEMAGQKLLSKPEGTPYTTEKLMDKISPFNAAKYELFEQYKKTVKELEYGYDSDNDWVKTGDNFKRGGYGFRHKVPLVKQQWEEKQAEAKRLAELKRPSENSSWTKMLLYSLGALGIAYYLFRPENQQQQQ